MHFVDPALERAFMAEADRAAAPVDRAYAALMAATSVLFSVRLAGRPGCALPAALSLTDLAFTLAALAVGRAPAGAAFLARRRQPLVAARKLAATAAGLSFGPCLFGYLSNCPLKVLTFGMALQIATHAFGYQNHGLWGVAAQAACAVVAFGNADQACAHGWLRGSVVAAAARLPARAPVLGALRADALAGDAEAVCRAYVVIQIAAVGFFAAVAGTAALEYRARRRFARRRGVAWSARSVDCFRYARVAAVVAVIVARAALVAAWPSGAPAIEAAGGR